MIYFLKNVGVHAVDPLKLRSCWNDVHQIYTQCSLVVSYHR